jgi:hypothetical protein
VVAGGAFSEQRVDLVDEDLHGADQRDCPPGESEAATR